MFEFAIKVNDEVVFEDLDPRTIIETVEVTDFAGAVIAEIAVGGKAGINLRFRTASLANRPYAYLDVINSGAWKKACDEYDAGAKLEVELSDNMFSSDKQ